MHCELVVPALFASQEIPRLPAAELLIARGRATQEDAGSLEEWLGEAFSIEERPFPAGAFTAHAQEAGADPAVRWVRADPVHLRLGNEGPSLVPAAGFALPRSEADRLVASLNEHFGADVFLVPSHPGQWCARIAFEDDVASVPPIEVAGGEAGGHLPGKRAIAFLTEIQMVLHEHPVNREREAQGEPPVNSVWLWGAGKLPSSAQAPWLSVTSNEALADGLARLAAIRSRPLPANASEWLERAPDEGRHLVVLEQLRGAFALGGAEAHASLLRDLEASWFAPLLDALRAGRIGMVTLGVPEAGTRWETIRGDLRRFWRRARPLGPLA